MFPKAGSFVPNRHRLSQGDYTRAIGQALRRELGGSGRATKTLMRWTGANERTARNWLGGTCGPSGKHLLMLFKESDAVLQTVMQISDRRTDLATVRLAAVAKALLDELSVIHAMLTDRTAHGRIE
jgi:hypothetical protein